MTLNQTIMINSKEVRIRRVTFVESSFSPNDATRLFKKPQLLLQPSVNFDIVRSWVRAAEFVREQAVSFTLPQQRALSWAANSDVAIELTWNTSRPSQFDPDNNIIKLAISDNHPPFKNCIGPTGNCRLWPEAKHHRQPCARTTCDVTSHPGSKRDSSKHNTNWKTELVAWHVHQNSFRLRSSRFVKPFPILINCHHPRLSLYWFKLHKTMYATLALFRNLIGARLHVSPKMASMTRLCQVAVDWVAFADGLIAPLKPIAKPALQALGPISVGLEIGVSTYEVVMAESTSLRIAAGMRGTGFFKPTRC